MFELTVPDLYYIKEKYITEKMLIDHKEKYITEKMLIVHKDFITNWNIQKCH